MKVKELVEQLCELFCKCTAENKQLKQELAEIERIVKECLESE